MSDVPDADDAVEFGLWVESAPLEYQGLILQRIQELDAETGDSFARRFVETSTGLRFIRTV